MKGIRLGVSLCLLALAAPEASRAVITFSQLSDTIFVVSHRVKFIGSRGQAMRLAYTKAASLCVAAGFAHFEILQQESQAGSEYETANSSIRVKYSMSEGNESLDCEKNADPEYIVEAQAKLLKMGYQPPEPEPATAEEGPPAEGTRAAGTPAGTCSIEQIVAMAKAGLEVEQIKAACPAE